jgi:glycosyltransferase involved in cell wall biosynthesis
MLEEKKKYKLSVCTTTYNRGYIIDRAFKSLQNQTCHDFEWVVIDDGSTDNTETLFKNWCNEENKFSIVYKKMGRGGRIRALNYGVNIVKGEYLFLLDSDDYLLPNAIEKLQEWINKIDHLEDIAGVGLARCYPNGEYIKGIPPKIDDSIGYVDARNIDRKYYDLDADMSEAYKVEILKKFPFQVWDNEMFAPEQLCFNEMALSGYKIRWYKDKLYVCNYLEDGLTSGNRSLLQKNPMGYAMMYNQMLNYEKGFISLFNCAYQHIALSLLGKNARYILKSNRLWLTLLAVPLGLALSIRRKIQLRF